MITEQQLKNMETSVKLVLILSNPAAYGEWARRTGVADVSALIAEVRECREAIHTLLQAMDETTASTLKQQFGHLCADISG